MRAILCEKVRAVKLTVVGCSPAWPNPGGAQSGYLVEGDGRLLLDCGPGVLGRLREREVWPAVDAIAITHFHLDHWGDLVPWVWGSMYGPGESVEKPQLYVPSDGRRLLAELGERLGSRDMFEESFRLSEYNDGESFSAAGFDVTPLRVPHYTIESYGFRVENEATVLAYSGDSAPSEALRRLAQDADLFVCEATLLEGRDELEPRGHLSLDEALDAYQASQARRLLVTHRPDERPLDHEVELAHDGLELDV
jgi:ribonuclease BN (tRNA processing enzyme)